MSEYTSTHTGSEIDTCIDNANSHMEDTVKHITDEERASWNDKVSKTDYAGSDNAGVMKISDLYGTSIGGGTALGRLIAIVRTLEQYNSLSNYAFIGKGTLENIKTDLFNRARLGNVKTSMDSVAVSNSIYLLGEQSAVPIVLPSSPNAGDLISVVFYSGSTATALSISGSTIGEVAVPSANQRVEISMFYDGTYWAIINNIMAVTT